MFDLLLGLAKLATITPLVVLLILMVRGILPDAHSHLTRRDLPR